MENTERKNLLPTFGSSFENGWKTMSSNFLILFLVVIIMGIVQAPTNLVHFNVDPADFHNTDFKFFNFLHTELLALGVIALFLGIFALAYILLIVPIFKFGANFMYVQATRGIRPEFDILIKGFKENYLHIVLANLLTASLVMMGFIALIVPGIIILCRLSFVSYLVMDKKLDPIVAVEESWRLTRGHGWTILAMGIVSFFIVILGFMMCFVGVFPAVIWVKSSFANLYQAVLIEREVQ